MRDKMKSIPLGEVWTDDRSREEFGDLEELKESILAHGVVQPITVAEKAGSDPGAKYKLLAGERRFRAAGLAGLDKIPALVKSDTDDVDDLEIELIENIHRKDFTWNERSRHIARLHAYCSDNHIEWSGRKLAKLLNKSQSEVQRALTLASALQVMPELADCKTQDEALKVLGKAKEQLLVNELRARQQKALERGLSDMLRIADTGYRIGDVFEGLAGLRTDDSSICLIECDPPYGIALNEVKRGEDRALAKTYNEIPADKYRDFLDRLCAELYRVAAPDCWLIFWFGPTWFTEVKKALTSAGWSVDDIPAIWTKGVGQTMQPEEHLARTYEPFFICKKGRPSIKKRGRANVFEFSPVPASEKYHPTQRPLSLMNEILETLTWPHAHLNILVPFVGSGVTLRAAYLYGTRAFGWDLNSEYKDRFMLAVEADSKRLGSEEE